VRGLGYWSAVYAVLAKDFRSELRSKRTVVTMAFFGLVLVFVFAFGFVNDAAENRKAFPGALWGMLLFTGSLCVGRTFAREAEAGAFSALMLAPVDRGAVVLAKMVFNTVLIVFVMALVTPLLAMMLRVDIVAHGGIIAALVVLGSAGFSAVGTPMAVLAVNARFAEVLLPTVVFPMVSPVIIAGVKGTGVVLGTTIGDDPLPWIEFLGAYVAFFAVGGVFLFDRMVTE
jgi:heme exporter protein B